MLSATMQSRALALALALASLLLITQQFGVQHALSHGRSAGGAGGAAGIWAAARTPATRLAIAAPAPSATPAPAATVAPAATLATPAAKATGPALRGGQEPAADGLCPVCLLLATLAAAALPAALRWRAAAPHCGAPVPRTPPARRPRPAAHYRARAPPARLALT